MFAMPWIMKNVIPIQILIISFSIFSSTVVRLLTNFDNDHCVRAAQW